jgi:hypothetical protein
LTHSVGRRLVLIERMKRAKRSARPPFRFAMIAGRFVRSAGQYRRGHMAVASSEVTMR